MPRPRSLSFRQVAETSLALIDREGLAALSMRSVAAELGMTAMSLYRYVDGREEIERLVAELVLGGACLAVPEGLGWKETILVLCGRIRSAVAAHPAVVPLLLVHRQATEASRRIGEALLSALADAGFEGERRVVAFRTLLSYLIGALQMEHLGPLSGAGTKALAALPEPDYPVLAKTAQVAQSIPVEQEFMEGLEIVLAGLDARRTARAPE